jgi:hypothetical protein
MARLFILRAILSNFSLAYGYDEREAEVKRQWRYAAEAAIRGALFRSAPMVRLVLRRSVAVGGAAHAVHAHPHR